MESVKAEPLGGLGSSQQQNRAPIYDLCDYCRLPIRPGESHGVIAPDDQGEPKLVCLIKRLELVETEIRGTVPTSALSEMTKR